MGINKKSVSLILGSGGARELAHIGVIQVLEENEYNQFCISTALGGGLGKWLCRLSYWSTHDTTCNVIPIT